LLHHLGEATRLVKLVHRLGATTRLFALRPLVLQGRADHLLDKGRELLQLKRAVVRAGRLSAERLEDLLFDRHLEVHVLGYA